MNINSKGYVARLGLTLFAITLVVAALLGVVNAVTVDRIAELKAEKSAEAMRAVLDADEYTDVDYTGDDALVASVAQALTDGSPVGYVVTVTPSGFGGTVELVVGVDLDGSCTGISIVDHSETSGLGANAAATTSTGEKFRSQFVGKSGTLAVTKDGGTIDALTGATITSRAVTRGVNAALAAVQALMG
jgi:electron transport complex protein RnfG